LVTQNREMHACHQQLIDENAMLWCSADRDFGEHSIYASSSTM